LAIVEEISFLSDQMQFLKQNGIKLAYMAGFLSYIYIVLSIHLYNFKFLLCCVFTLDWLT